MRIGEDLGLQLSGNIFNEMRQSKEKVLNSVGSLRKFISFNKAENMATVGQRYKLKNNKDKAEVYSYEVKPMAEARIAFEMSKDDLDMINQGIEPFNLDAFEDAVYKLIEFEENLFFNGIDNLNLEGFNKTIENEEIKTDGSPNSVINAIQKASVVLRKNYIEGPYKLIMGKDMLEYTSQLVGDRTLSNIIEKQLKTNITVSEYIKGALLVPMHSDDIKANVGKDITVDVDYIEEENVKFYLSEALNFDILDPNIAVKIKVDKK